MHKSEDLIKIFNHLFKDKYQTILLKGTSEPIYRIQSDDKSYNQIVFAHGFFSSALHEIAHWCVAGKERRHIEDYGYWYKPDGRSPEEQSVFYQVEVKPQALEWIFSTAANYKFHFSADNINGEAGDMEQFKQDVQQQVFKYIEEGIPHRAMRFAESLCEFYQVGNILTRKLYQLEMGLYQ